MNYEKNYEKNIATLKKHYKTLYDKLLMVSENKKYDVYTLKNGIDIVDKHASQLLYNEEPNQYTIDKFDSFNKKYGLYPFTYHFGIGNGSYYKKLFTKSGIRRTVIIEPEIELIYISLHLNDFSYEISNSMLMIFLLEDFNYNVASELFQSIKGAMVFSKTYTFDIHCDYYSSYIESIKLVNNYILEAIQQIAYSLGTNPQDTILGVKRHVSNLKKAVTTPSLNELTSKAKNSEVAVVVATGPSLNKQLQKLKEIQNSVTIFCLDASFPILIQNEIKPDIVFSIERSVEPVKFYNGVDKKHFKNVIFSFSSILHPDIIKAAEEGVLSFSFRNYEFIKYYNLHDYEFLARGMSVANMAHELTYLSGFQTCILIGQDLAYGDDGSSHSKNHVFGEKQIHEDGKDSCDNTTYNIIDLEGYGGGHTVKSILPWKLFKNYFEEEIFIALRDYGMTTVNSTEGGVRIQGAIEIPFAQAISQFVDKSFQKNLIKLTPRDTKDIQKDFNSIDDTNEKIINILKKTSQEANQLHGKILEITDYINKTEAFSKNDKKLILKAQKLNKTIDKFKFKIQKDDLGSILNNIIGTMVMNLEMEIAKTHIKPLNTQRDKEVFILQWPFLHREWVYNITLAIKSFLEAVALGLLDENNTTLLAKHFLPNEIEYLNNNRHLFEFE
ncbi:MAG: 6-hydroxymethylpterin diphosphokinase MptE-like protein [Campylobacterota bacterium]|nr:6-hydroxymethylpterin diphosphokinase MptE-like protein [Campylobacterota bacterium]